MRRTIMITMMVLILLLTGCSEVSEGDVFCITTGGYQEGQTLPSQYEVKVGSCGFTTMDETVEEFVEPEPEPVVLEEVSDVIVIPPTKPEEYEDVSEKPANSSHDDE